MEGGGEGGDGENLFISTAQRHERLWWGYSREDQEARLDQCLLLDQRDPEMKHDGVYQVHSNKKGELQRRKHPRLNPWLL